MSDITERPYGDLRNAKWLDPECHEAGACQSLKFKAQVDALRSAASDLRQQLDDERRQHDITRGAAELLRMRRDELERHPAGLHWLPLAQPPADPVAEVLLWVSGGPDREEWSHYLPGAWQDGEFMLADGDPLPAGWSITHYAIVRGPGGA